MGGGGAWGRGGGGSLYASGSGLVWLRVPDAKTRAEARVAKCQRQAGARCVASGSAVVLRLGARLQLPATTCHHPRLCHALTRRVVARPW